MTHWVNSESSPRIARAYNESLDFHGFKLTNFPAGYCHSQFAKLIGTNRLIVVYGRYSICRYIELIPRVYKPT